MRVGLVCPYSLSLPGGVQGQVLGLARALRAKGHDARVLGPCDGPPPETGVIPLGDTVATLANGSVAPLAPDISCVLRTIRALRDEDFDVVHLHEPLAPGPTLTSVVFTSTPTIGTFHAAGTSAAYIYLRPLTRWLGRQLSIRCAVSEDARDMASRALGGEYLVLHNGIDIERYTKATPWPTEAPTILFLSRHESRKGLAVLLEALAYLPADVRVWVASDGPETSRLRAKVAGDNRVEWLGRITEEEKAQRLRTADVLCAPSLGGESFGMVLLEGMAAQTAIVASDLPGYSNVARHEQEALLVPRGDARALAEALRRVMGEPQLAASLIAGGEARAAEFSMDSLADRYLELYEQAVQNSGLEVDYHA
jgi:phosphatidylinositol alpha-mannosyltransferase